MLRLLNETADGSAHSGPMHQTYELYLRDEPQGAPRFRPLTCPSPVEAMRKVRELLDEERSLASVEVRLAGQHLFTLDR